MPDGVSRSELDVHLETEIGTMDLKKDIVTSKLAESVQDNYSAFIQGMRQVQEVDLDISHASIHVRCVHLYPTLNGLITDTLLRSNGRRHLESVKQHTIIKHLQIVRKRRNVDRMQMVLCSYFKFIVLCIFSRWRYIVK